MIGLTRRTLVGGLIAAGVVAPAGLRAEAPERTPFPPARSGKGTGRKAGGALPADAGELIRAAALGGVTTFVLADGTGRNIIAASGTDQPVPPASTVKTITSLYALTALGPGYRFGTHLLATGPVVGGVIRGDLILAGGGDPTLSTDDLGDMAAALASAGVRGVDGRFCVWGGALPYLHEIDRGQPDWLGYNPAVGGLNLNFNRVNFTWARAGGGYKLGFDARAERYAPTVASARMEVVDRDLPLFTYRQEGRVDDWTVASAALGREGSRWLPVRRPDLYAGDVFRALMRAKGVAMPAPEAIDGLPQGTSLAAHQSAPLPGVLRDMMKYSTNMTAEVVGMTASQSVGVKGHDASAAAMTRWIADATGEGGLRFEDHSGLGGGSRVTASAMVRALGLLGPRAGLGGLMKEVRFKGAKGIGAGPRPQMVVAKTGTLNFVSGLVGYLTTASGDERVFAIYSADVERRDAVRDVDREKPPGLSGWLLRARRLQLQLLASWA